MKIAKLCEISMLISVSILIGNPPNASTGSFRLISKKSATVALGHIPQEIFSNWEQIGAQSVTSCKSPHICCFLVLSNMQFFVFLEPTSVNLDPNLDKFTE